MPEQSRTAIYRRPTTASQRYPTTLPRLPDQVALGTSSVAITNLDVGTADCRAGKRNLRLGVDILPRTTNPRICVPAPKPGNFSGIAADLRARR